jgi:hypothetical protein
MRVKGVLLEQGQLYRISWRGPAPPTSTGPHSSGSKQNPCYMRVEGVLLQQGQLQVGGGHSSGAEKNEIYTEYYILYGS